MFCKKDPQKHLCILRISRYCIALRTTVPELLLRTRSLILTQLNIFKMVSNLFKFLTVYNNYGVILIMYEARRSYRARFFRLHLF